MEHNGPKPLRFIGDGPDIENYRIPVAQPLNIIKDEPDIEHHRMFGSNKNGPNMFPSLYG